MHVIHENLRDFEKFKHTAPWRPSAALAKLQWALSGLCVEMHKKKEEAKNTREDISSSSLVTSIMAPVSAVDPWSLLLTEM